MHSRNGGKELKLYLPWSSPLLLMQTWVELALSEHISQGVIEWQLQEPSGWPFDVCFTALCVAAQAMHPYLPSLTLDWVFTATRLRYLRKGSAPSPPLCINGIPGNATTRGLIAYSSGFLKIYFMLSIQFVCVLSIITVIGLIKASQGLKSPFPIFPFYEKNVFKNSFALGSRSLCSQSLRRKRNTFFCKHGMPSGRLCYCLTS